MGALGSVVAHLDLTDAQKDQLKGIMDSHRDESKGLGDRAMKARQALRAAVTADTVDEGLIRTRAAELATIESDLAVAQARIHADVFRILTPEQQAQAREAQHICSRATGAIMPGASASGPVVHAGHTGHEKKTHSSRVLVVDGSRRRVERSWCLFSRCADGFVPQHGSHRLDDVTGRNAVAVRQPSGLPLLRNRAQQPDGL